MMLLWDFITWNIYNWCTSSHPPKGENRNWNRSKNRPCKWAFMEYTPLDCDNLKACFILTIWSAIFLLLANVIEWMTCKRLRIVYFWKATLYFCVRVHSFASVRNTKSPTKLLVWTTVGLIEIAVCRFLEYESCLISGKCMQALSILCPLNSRLISGLEVEKKYGLLV